VYNKIEIYDLIGNQK